MFHEGIGPDGIYVLGESGQVDPGIVAVGAGVVIPANVDLRFEGFRRATGHPVKVVHRLAAEIQPAFQHGLLSEILFCQDAGLHDGLLVLLCQDEEFLPRLFQIEA